MNRPNEILLRLWMVFKVADRAGQRRSKAFTAALETLARVSFEGRFERFRIAKAEEQGYGYDPLADAVWIHRGTIGLLIGYAVAAPEKNFFSREKPLIQKLSSFMRAKKDVDVATTFMPEFAAEQEDIAALLHSFGRTLGDTPWIGVPSVGWGVPEDVFWIGISGGEEPWPANRDEQGSYRLRLWLSRPYPENELWPNDERARAIQLQRLIRPLPAAEPPSWQTETLLPPQPWKVWYAPRSFWQRFLPGLAATHGATSVEQVSDESIYAEMCTFGSLRGRFAFWFPDLASSGEPRMRTYYYRERFRAVRRALATQRHAADWYVIATPWLHDFIYSDLYPLARSGSLPAPLLVLDEPLTYSYIGMLPWLFFLHDAENPRDEEDFPIVVAESSVDRHAQVMVYLIVWVLHAATSNPPTMHFVSSFVEKLLPGRCEPALNALIEARVLRRCGESVHHHNVPFPGIADLGRVLRWLGYDQFVYEFLSWARAYAVDSESAENLLKFQERLLGLRGWQYL